MGKLIAIIIIAIIGWFVYSDMSVDKIKENAIEALKKEKTINTINSRRAQDQEDINKVFDGE